MSVYVGECCTMLSQPGMTAWIFAYLQKDALGIHGLICSLHDSWEICPQVTNDSSSSYIGSKFPEVCFLYAAEDVAYI